jgi:hypothetical protein
MYLFKTKAMNIDEKKSSKETVRINENITAQFL